MEYELFLDDHRYIFRGNAVMCSHNINSGFIGHYLLKDEMKAGSGGTCLESQDSGGRSGGRQITEFLYTEKVLGKSRLHRTVSQKNK